MTVEINFKPGIQIPRHLYNEAAELFLNHLEEYYEAQLLKDGSSLLTSQELGRTKNIQLIYHRPQLYVGQSCPLYYKKRTGIYSDLQVRRNGAFHTAR